MINFFCKKIEVKRILNFLNNIKKLLFFIILPKNLNYKKKYINILMYILYLFIYLWCFGIIIS